VKKSAPARAGAAPYRVVAVGDTIISERGLVAIIDCNPRYQVCGAAHTFEEANRLVRQHCPDLLLIEPFLENRDAIRWIKDLATEFSRIRILVVSRQSELTYAERALHAGASGYWMKNSSLEELMHAIETVLAGEIYASQAIASLAMRKFARGRSVFQISTATFQFPSACFFCVRMCASRTGSSCVFKNSNVRMSKEISYRSMGPNNATRKIARRLRDYFLLTH
jgi:DNA-binding NarL/FixJ family response regulator